MPKFTPKCPACGSVLEKAKKGYECPNSGCKVIKVFFSRSRRVERIVYEGIDFPRTFSRSRRKKRG